MPDERQPGRDGDPPRPDETRPMRAVDDDATRVQPNQPSGRPRSGDTPTEPLSPAGGWDPDPRGGEELWTGRATVRPPGPETSRYSDTTEWTPGPPGEEPPGRWWMPIVIGIVALLLLGVLAYGIYLIAQNSGAGTDAPAPTPAQTRTTTATTPSTTEPTTEAPPST